MLKFPRAEAEDIDNGWYIDPAFLRLVKAKLGSDLIFTDIAQIEMILMAAERATNDSNQ